MTLRPKYEAGFVFSALRRVVARHDQSGPAGTTQASDRTQHRTRTVVGRRPPADYPGNCCPPPWLPRSVSEMTMHDNPQQRQGHPPGAEVPGTNLPGGPAGSVPTEQGGPLVSATHAAHLRAVRERLRRARARCRRPNEGTAPGPRTGPPDRRDQDPVTLHRDLELRLTRTPFGVRLVDHPLLVAPASEERYAEYNARYTRQREQFDRAVAAGDWEGALDLVRERHAWAFLWEHRDHFAPDAYWAHLARLWTGAECFWPVEELLPRMLAHHAGQRSHFMYARERGELDSMPELFRVYRGHVWGEWRGWSW